MKTALELQRIRKWVILFMVGIVCSIISMAVYIINPVKLILDHKLEMRPGSLAFTLWENPPVPVYMQVYIFNITNPDEFLKGGVNLKVEEIGPYVYQEFLENKNVTWHKNGTMSYIPIRKVVFVPERSVGNPHEHMISVPNIPLLGFSSSMANAGFFVNYPLTQLANYLGSKPILNITVHDYLWGYEDSLVRLASGIVPNFINFRKFGLLDRMYDEGENVVTMNINKSKNMTDENGRYLSIYRYNGSPGLSHWGYVAEKQNETNPGNTICNRIEGATEGVIFPPKINKEAVFRIFRKSFCRAIPIEYKEEVDTVLGTKGFLYSLSDNFLDTPDQNSDNECYCRKSKTCLKKGLSDLTPCYYNIPAAISLPHFLDADQTLLKGIEGMNPDPKKHRTRAVIEPNIGMPVHVNSRLQTNLVMQKTYYNSKITPFNELTVPLFWTDLTIPHIPEDLIDLLRLALYIGPILQSIIIYGLAVIGTILVIVSLVGTTWTVNQDQKLAEQNERRDSVDLRIPLGYGQYTAIRILPAIKKITSKTDLFT